MSRYTNVAVQHRGDYPLTGIQWNGEEIVWQPRETKYLPMDMARHCIRNSAVRFDPITLDTTYQLVERTPGDAEPTVLSYDEGHPAALLDTSNMPETSFDAEGRPLRGELKTLAEPTGMLRGRIPAGASAGVPAWVGEGAAKSGLGASGPMPKDIAERLDRGTDALIDQVADA